MMNVFPLTEVVCEPANIPNSGISGGIISTDRPDFSYPCIFPGPSFGTRLLGDENNMSVCERAHVAISAAENIWFDLAALQGRPVPSI